MRILFLAACCVLVANVMGPAAIARPWKSCAEAKQSLSGMKTYGPQFAGQPGQMDVETLHNVIAELEVDVRNTCTLGPARAYELEKERTRQIGIEQQQAASNAAASFFLGFAEGFIGSAGAGAIRHGGHTLRRAPAARINARYAPTRGVGRNVNVGAGRSPPVRSTASARLSAPIQARTVSPGAGQVRTSGARATMSSQGNATAATGGGSSRAPSQIDAGRAITNTSAKGSTASSSNGNARGVATNTPANRSTSSAGGGAIARRCQPAQTGTTSYACAPGTGNAFLRPDGTVGVR
jgi:hypothetical protein